MRDSKGLAIKLYFRTHIKIISLLMIFLTSSVSFYAAHRAMMIKTHYSFDQFQPSGHPLIRDSKEIQKLFGIKAVPSYSLILGLDKELKWNTQEHLKILDKIGKDLKKHGQFIEVMGLSQVQTALSSKDRFDLGSVLELAQRDPDHLSWITESSLLTPHLLSYNGSETVLLLKPNQIKNDIKLKLRVQSIVEDSLKHSTLAGKVKTRLGGAGMITNEMMELLSKETIMFVGMALLSAMLLLALLFRSLRTVGIILYIIICANAISLGAMELLNLSFTVLTSTVPILVTITVLAICSHSLIHIFAKFYSCEGKDLQCKKMNRIKLWLLITNSMKSLWIPHVLTALTTAVGFGTLLFSNSPIIYDFGLSVVVSVIVACTVSLILLPALLLWQFYPVTALNFSFDGLVDKMPKYRWGVVLGGLILLSLTGWRGGSLSWTSQLFDDLPKSHSVRLNTEYINEKLGGTIPLEVVIRPLHANWNELIAIRSLSKLVSQWMEESPVKSAISIIDFVRMADPEKKLPMSQGGLSEVYFLYAMADENPLSSYLSSDNRTTRIGLRLDDVPANEMEQIKTLIVSTAKQVFPDSDVRLGGMGATAHAISDELSSGLMKGFLYALLGIFVLLSLVFRSIKWAFAAVLPNLVPPLILLGILGVFKIPIKPGVAIVFSISLGIAFDNTVYILGRLRELLKSGTYHSRLPVQELMKRETGACLISSACLFAGFSIFLMSLFSVNQLFGLFMLISIAAGIFGDLVLLPAILCLCPRILNIPGGNYELVKR